MPANSPPFKRRLRAAPNLFREALREVSASLAKTYKAEKKLNQNNFESGLPVEDYFREALAKLLDDPYGVDVGHVVDREHYTCGECDCVIYDKRLSPVLRPPATSKTRRKHLAFEATYGIIEVKQTLTLGATKSGKLVDKPKGSLWEACRKIFAYKELRRELRSMIRWGTNLPIGLVFFFDSSLKLTTNEDKDALLTEFALINAAVPPEVRVDGLYILNRASVMWSFLANPATKTLLTLHHASEAPAPVWLSLAESGKDTLCKLYQHLWSLLGRTQLASPDLLNDYGGSAVDRSGRLRSLPCTVEAAALGNALDPDDLDLSR